MTRPNYCARASNMAEIHQLRLIGISVEFVVAAVLVHATTMSLLPRTTPVVNMANMARNPLRCPEDDLRLQLTGRKNQRLNTICQVYWDVRNYSLGVKHISTCVDATRSDQIHKRGFWSGWWDQRHADFQRSPWRTQCGWTIDAVLVEVLLHPRSLSQSIADSFSQCNWRQSLTHNWRVDSVSRWPTWSINTGSLPIVAVSITQKCFFEDRFKLPLLLVLHK